MMLAATSQSNAELAAIPLVGLGLRREHLHDLLTAAVRS